MDMILHCRIKKAVARTSRNDHDLVNMSLDVVGQPEMEPIAAMYVTSSPGGMYYIEGLIDALGLDMPTEYDNKMLAKAINDLPKHTRYRVLVKEDDYNGRHRLMVRHVAGVVEEDEV